MPKKNSKAPVLIKIQITFPLSFTLMFACCIWISRAILLLNVWCSNWWHWPKFKTTQQKPFLVPWGQWMKGSVLYHSERKTLQLWGAERRSQRTSPLLGALFPFLNLSVACPLFPHKQILFLSVCRKDLKGEKDRGEFRNGKGKRVYKIVCFMSKIHWKQREEKPVWFT